MCPCIIEIKCEEAAREGKAEQLVFGPKTQLASTLSSIQVVVLFLPPKIDWQRWLKDCIWSAFTTSRRP